MQLNKVQLLCVQASSCTGTAATAHSSVASFQHVWRTCRCTPWAPDFGRLPQRRLLRHGNDRGRCLDQYVTDDWGKLFNSVRPFSNRKRRAQNWAEQGASPVAQIHEGAVLAVFSFLYLKKINFKNICLFWKISKIYPGRSPIGRQAQSVIFFLQICNEVSGEKKGRLSPPPTGDRGLSPTPGATGSPPLL